MTLKLIATDLDGTLLRDDKTFDYARFETLLDRMDEQGIHFVAASGNQLAQMEYYFIPVGANRITYVSDNGALVTYKGQTLDESTLTRAQIEKVINWNNEHHDKMENLIILTGNKGAYISDWIPDEIKYEVAKFYPKLYQVDKLLEIDDQIFKLSFVWPENVDVHDAVKSLRDIFGEELHATGSGFGSVDILAHGTNKRTGLEELANVWHIKPDEMAAFGDNGNDLEMLRYVKHPFVMPNAEDFMKVRIDGMALNDNNHNGVLDTIEALLDGVYDQAPKQMR